MNKQQIKKQIIGHLVVALKAGRIANDFTESLSEKDRERAFEVMIAIANELARRHALD